MRYWLDFGDGTEGSSPAFLVFQNADTLVDLTPPTIIEDAEGLFYFDWTWSTSASAISYKVATLGVELADVIHSDTLVTGSGTASAGAAIPDWAWTAGQIINTAAVECGLSEFSDPYASTDANALRLRTLLKTAGMELVRKREWKSLIRECTITGDGVNSIFSLPNDFDRMVDDSGWSRTGVEPMAILSSQGWQVLKASATVGATDVYFRIVQNRIQFYDVQASASVSAFDYVSRFWAAASGSTAADLQYPAASGDYVILDPVMVKRVLAARFLAATGQIPRQEMYREVVEAIEAGADAEPAPTLSMSRTRVRPVQFNVEDRGYGS